MKRNEFKENGKKSFFLPSVTRCVEKKEEKKRIREKKKRIE